MLSGQGFIGLWLQGDWISRLLMIALGGLSALSWAQILRKAWFALEFNGYRQQVIEEFWRAGDFRTALTDLRKQDLRNVFWPLAEKALHASIHHDANCLENGVDSSDRITRALRQQINNAAANLESGLTFLASVGSTAPFIGLFGTVWGIYHALVNISAQSAIQIDKIAGPVGEALIMTAAGLAVAIPAVLAYNFFVRVNRLILLELDGFAHDLHSLLTTGMGRQQPMQ
jgi:biopolymer transport protein ExbB